MKRLLIFSAFLIFCSSAYSQKKVKYKDLYPLLKDKNYMMAEPDLRTYLSNEKNQDEGNPNYHMGLILEKKFLDQNVLGDTTTVFAYGDSASYFFSQAIEYIDDKELRKNDEYYQEFYRRDLRTGEFGVKLSDVHLEIENRIKDINERKSKVNTLYTKLASLKGYEESAVTLFNELVDEFGDFNSFVMQADLAEIGELGNLSEYHSSINKTSAEIITIARELELTDKYTEVEWTDVPGFYKTEGFMKPMDGTIETYHFDNWVDATKKVINSEIADLKFKITALDEELVNANDQLSNGRPTKFPTSLPDELRQTTTRYNANTAPLDLLEVRMLENIYLTITDRRLNPRYQDSAYVSYQYQVNDSLLDLSVKLYELTKSLQKSLKPSQKSYFNFYNTRYGDIEEVMVYVNKMNDWSDFFRVQIAEKLEYWDFRNNWGIMPNDTIPLVKGISKPYNGDYKVLSSFRFDDSNELIAVGYQKDSTQGFLAKFGEDRMMKWKINIEGESFKENVTDTVRFAVDTLVAGNQDFAVYFFVENPVKEEINNLIITSVNLAGEINWATPLSVKKAPTYSTYSEAIKQHTVFLYPKEAYPLPGDELGYIVIDRTGEAK